MSNRSNASSSGADPNCSDKGGCSGLYMACLRGHTDVISLLLSRGAKVNMQTDEGATGLSIACQMRVQRYRSTSFESREY